jgi:hypothetical protein
LASIDSTAIRRGNLVVVGVFSFHVAVVVEANGAPMLCHQGEGWLKLSSPLNAVRNSSMESLIVAHYGVDAPLQVEPTKMAPLLPPLGDRLRPSK